MEDFVSLEECEKLRAECDKIIDSNHFLEELNKIPVFSGNENETKVHYFINWFIKKPYILTLFTVLINDLF
jgi:hypothetical protein